MPTIAENAKIRHGSAFKPLMIAYDGDVNAPHNVDRCLGVRDGWTIPAEKRYELGRKVKVCTDKGLPDVTASISQSEYGDMDIFNVLANKSSSNTDLVLSDFDDSKIDLITVEDEEYGGNLIMCKHLAKQSVAGFTISVGDADSPIERAFDLTGDKRFTWKEANKCFIYKRFVYTNPGDEVLDVSDPAPVADPDTSKDIYQILRVRAGVTTELFLTTDYTFAANAITILDEVAADIYKVYYTASTWGTAGSPVAQNDVDACYVKPEQCDFLIIETGPTEYKIHKLTSASIAATLDRRMEGELGSDEKVIRDVTSRAVSITLGSFVTDSSFDELMRGKAGQNYGKIDIEKFVSTLKFVVKVYTDKTKTAFKLGYSVSNLEYNTGGSDNIANDLSSKDITLESDEMIISTVEGNL